METIIFCKCPTCGHHKEERMILTKSELVSIILRYTYRLDTHRLLQGNNEPIHLDKFAEEFVDYVIRTENETKNNI